MLSCVNSLVSLHKPEKEPFFFRIADVKWGEGSILNAANIFLRCEASSIGGLRGGNLRTEHVLVRVSYRRSHTLTVSFLRLNGVRYEVVRSVPVTGRQKGNWRFKNVCGPRGYLKERNLRVLE